MKQGLPWSIKGIDPEARDVAKSAAKSDGLTLGAWMTKMIFERGQQGTARPEAASNASAGANAETAQVDMETLVRVVGVLIQKVEKAESSDAERSDELMTLIRGLSDSAGQSTENPSADSEAAASAHTESPKLSAEVAEGVEDLEAGPDPLFVEPDVAAAPEDDLAAITDDEAAPVSDIQSDTQNEDPEGDAAAHASDPVAPGSINPGAMDRAASSPPSGKVARLGTVVLVGGLILAGFSIPVIFPDLAASVLSLF